MGRLIRCFCLGASGVESCSDVLVRDEPLALPLDLVASLSRVGLGSLTSVEGLAETTLLDDPLCGIWPLTGTEVRTIDFISSIS